MMQQTHTPHHLNMQPAPCIKVLVSRRISCGAPEPKARLFFILKNSAVSFRRIGSNAGMIGIRQRYSEMPILFFDI